MTAELPAIDFHTHEAPDVTCCHPERVWRIVSTALPMPETLDNATIFRTLELHPWQGEPFTDDFSRAAEDARFIALGEVGLDKKRGRLAMEAQRGVFRQCTALATRLHKPLILHCVGAFAELLEEYKRQPWPVPTILHYFCGKPELARQLLAGRDRWYLSLPPLATKSARLMEVLRTDSALRERIVLETDDPAGDIEAHYEVMSQVLSWPPEALRSAMHRRFKEIFLS